MSSTLGACSTTLHPSEGDKNSHLGLENLDTTMFLTDAEALLVKQLHPLSSNNTSDDQCTEYITSHNKTGNLHEVTEARRRQIYRRVQKRDREELRRQVDDLKEELARVRVVKEREKAKFNATQTPAFWFWKSIATRQRYERSLAEEEQRALVVSSQAQAAYIRTLAKIAQLPENNSFALTGEDQVINDHKKQRCGVSEPELFNAFIQDLDTNCEHIDELLKACRSKVRKPGGMLEYSQLYITETIPFSLSQTSRFLWQFGTGHHSSNPSYKTCAGVRDPENTSARSFRNAVTLENGVKVSLWNRLVTRRYDEGRIYAWKLVSEGEGGHNGFQFDETAWLSLNASELGTVIEMCIQRTPMHFTSAMPRDRERFERALHQLHDKSRDDILTSLQGVLIDDVLEHLDIMDADM